MTESDADCRDLIAERDAHRLKLREEKEVEVKRRLKEFMKANGLSMNDRQQIVVPGQHSATSSSASSASTSLPRHFSIPKQPSI